MVNIDIDFGAQRMHVVSDSGANYNWPISSGRPGHATPRGIFAPQHMYKMVYSWKYGNAPMPHSIFFYGHYRHPRHDGGRHARPCRLARLRTALARRTPRRSMASSSAKARGSRSAAQAPEGIAANPHKAGHRLASEQRKRMKDQALGYAPGRGAQTLKQWVAQPVRARLKFRGDQHRGGKAPTARIDMSHFGAKWFIRPPRSAPEAD